MKMRRHDANNIVSWLHHIREIEFFKIESFLHADKETKILELGCGDGYLSTLLSQYSDFVLPTDITIQRNNVSAMKLACRAEYLPFKPNSFDIVFSSHVLEHVSEKSLCLEEMMRVLSKDGFMIHIMPTSLWAIIRLLCFAIVVYPKKISKLLKVLRANKSYHIRGSKDRTTRRGSRAIGTKSLADIISSLFPHVHGSWKNLLHEILRSRESKWHQYFSQKSVEVKVIPLYFGSGYCFFKGRLMGLRSFFTRIGLAISKAYIVIPEK